MLSAQAGGSPQTARSLADEMRDLLRAPAVPGYEQQLADRIASQLHYLSPRVDGESNVIVTMGSGSPHRLLVAPMDEPGFVVSRITPEGYLQLQRLPQAGALPLFNELYSAQPVAIQASSGKWVNGAVAGLSIHLLPGRLHPPSPADLDEMFVDVGATSAAQVHAAGVDVLGPLAIQHAFYDLGYGRWTSPAIGDRFGDAALLQLLQHLDRTRLKGTLTVAFVAQQWAGARGLQRMIYEQKPDELIFVGRLMRIPAIPGQRTTPPEFKEAPGSGVLIASEPTAKEPDALESELQQLAQQSGIPVKSDISAGLIPRSYLPAPPLPARTVHLAVATAWPSTPGEIVDGHDVAGLVELLENYLQGHADKIAVVNAPGLPNPALPRKPAVAPSPEVTIKQLIETYGVSGGHEAPVADMINRLLPSWAKTEKDDAGNLILKWPGNPKAPGILVVAHQDEIGFEVKSVLPDGRLELKTEGGGVLAYFMGHAAFIHSGNGIHPAVLELPEGWDKADFQWPRGPRTQFRLDLGAHNPEEVAQLGIKAGDFVTVPKQYHKLLGTRAAARSFDDRIGCAALVDAVWALGPNLKDRNVTFVWSTSEELGLNGAGAVARRMAAGGHAPDYVFAVDTFVSSDSPLESPRFGDALVGHGFVGNNILD